MTEAAAATSIQVNYPSCDQDNTAWMWLAVYKNLTYVTECQGEGQPHKARADVDMTNVRALAWVPTRSQDLPTITLDIPIDGTPTFVRRNALAMGLIDGQEKWRTTIHILGYEAPGGSHYVYLFEDGHTEVADNFYAYA